MFGNTATSAFGQPTAQAAAGTAGTAIVKYQPTIGTDTLMKGGQPNNVNTKQHCITAMKEYESKSLEELRMEDYLANRKGPQAGPSGTVGFFGATQPNATGTGLFGPTTQQTTGLFGQPAAQATENKSLFGTSAFGQPNTSAFGTATQQQNSFLGKPFGATATSAFGQTTTDSAANPFGTKPAFGQTAAPSLFGQQPATSAVPAFGQTNTGFGGFGQTGGAAQPTLFGQPAADPNKPAFGLGNPSTGNTGFGGFGVPNTSTANTGLFGAKPQTGFGTAPAFGATSTANTGFPNFSTNNANAGGGMFNSNMNKQPTSGFGAFGAQTSQAPLNFNTGTGGTSLFGNTTANRPVGLFGNTLGTGTGNTTGGMFATGANNFGTNNTMGGSFGTNPMGGNPNLGGMVGMSQQQTVPIHQQILSKVTSPYGDNPIFKDLKPIDEIDALRATNPVAQKAILENSTSNQFKVTAKPSPNGLKIKPVGTALTKKALFEGLEEFDSSVESFSLKPNAKRLVIKPKPNPSSMIGSGSGLQSSVIGSTSSTPIGIAGGSTPQSQLDNSVTTPRNETFNAEIPLEPTQPVTSSAQTSSNSSTGNKNFDTSRRESWLHPNNLEKVRQHNLNTGTDPVGNLNNTLSELVPRKPIETYRPISTAGRLSMSTVPENPFEDSSNTVSRRDTVTFSENVSDSFLSNRTYETEERSAAEEPIQTEFEEHPTGITLRRVG